MGTLQWRRKGQRRRARRKSNNCEGYDWGYNYAKADVAFVKAIRLQAENVVAGHRNRRELAYFTG